MLDQNQFTRRMRTVAMVVAPLCLLAVAGCLGEPEIDERWTLIEMKGSSPRPGHTVNPGETVSVTVDGQITYRRIRTGFLVAEVRYSPDLAPGALDLDPEEHTLTTSHQVERVLNSSVTAGRATKAVTGFDHLVQRINFAFDAIVPAEMLNGDPDSVANRGLYLVLYLAEGEEIILADNRDSLVVTPLPVDEYELLFTGFALGVQAVAP